MKRLLCAVAAVAMVVPAAAAAQPPQHQQQQRHRHGNKGGQPGARKQVQQRRSNRQQQRTVQRRNVQTRINNKVVVKPTVRTNRVTREVVYRPGHRPSSFHRIRARPFRYPHGYRYRRWNVGLILPRVFLSNYYYWSDWRALGLLPPPPGYVWVRFGPDLLLVNRYTGRIADVIYGAFYY